MREVLRNERKFLMNRMEFVQKSHQLRQLLHEDGHNGSQGYLIRSLYFDTEYDGDFFDKEYGMEIRRSAVDLVCRRCGAKLRLPAATDRDLDNLCCHWKLRIPGTKA